MLADSVPRKRSALPRSRPRRPPPLPPWPGETTKITQVTDPQRLQIISRLDAELADIELPVSDPDPVTEMLLCWRLYLDGAAVRSLSISDNRPQQVAATFALRVGSDTVVRSHMWLAVNHWTTEEVRRRGFVQSWPGAARLCDLVEEVCEGRVPEDIDEKQELVDELSRSVRPLSRTLSDLITRRSKLRRDGDDVWVDLDLDLTLVGYDDVMVSPRCMRVASAHLESVTIEGLEHLESDGDVYLTEASCTNLETIRSGRSIEVRPGVRLNRLTSLQADGDIDLDFHAWLRSLVAVRCGGVLKLAGGQSEDFPSDLQVGCHIEGHWCDSEDLCDAIDAWNAANARCTCDIPRATILPGFEGQYEHPDD